MIYAWLRTADTQVSPFPVILPHLLSALKHLSDLFMGGRIKSKLGFWAQLTSDSFILQMVQGAPLTFLHTPLQRHFSTKRFSPAEAKFIDFEVHKLLSKDIIMASQHEEGEYISPIFLVDKKDGGKRLILNLKGLNEYIEYHHFKMHTILHILRLVTPNCFMAVIDIQDAYYSVPIDSKFQKYLKFFWVATLYQFCVFPNGLAPAPRYFTKLMKPVTATLREQGHINSIYIDDMYLQGVDYQDCLRNVTATLYTLVSLGFCPHPAKCHLLPSQVINILGFCINSISMRISLTSEKQRDLLQVTYTILNLKRFTIRALAGLIGKLVAAFPAVQYGPLYYRYLEKNKQLALTASKGDYDASTQLLPNARAELVWWSHTIPVAFSPIIIAAPTLEIFTDASNEGWGAQYDGMTTQGSWSTHEVALHINVKEMLAVLFGLKSLLKDIHQVNVKLNIDNTTAVGVIKHMGTSHSDDLNRVAKDIWLWAMHREVWLFPVYISSTDNPADEPSRNIYMDAEWQLNPDVFTYVLSVLNFVPDIDLFASRLNTQLEKYVLITLTQMHLQLMLFPCHGQL